MVVSSQRHIHTFQPRRGEEGEITRLTLQPIGKGEIRLVKRSLVQLYQAVDQKGVVVGKAPRVAGPFAVHSAQLASLLVERMLADEVDGPDGVRTIPRCPLGIAALESCAGARQRPNRQAVPARDDLVVEIRARPLLLAVLPQLRPAGRDALHHLGLGQAKVLGQLRRRAHDGQHVLLRELVVRVVRLGHVAVRLDVPVARANVGVGLAQNVVKLFLRPDVEGAFALLAIATAVVRVGVFGGMEAAGGSG